MIVRVTELGKPAFQLRKGEEGISVFDLDSVDPSLTDAEVLDAFRPDSEVVTLSSGDISSKGLRIIAIPGAEPLPARLRAAHAEIRPGPGMTRIEFKQALKELE